MRKRMMGVIAVGALVAGLFGMQSASAACETGEGGGPDGGNPRRHGNEIAGLYVGQPPVDGNVAGHGILLRQAWVEVQDDGQETPVAVEFGLYGDFPFLYGFGVDGCSDWTIQYVEDELDL